MLFSTKLKRFKKSYCTTIVTDPKTKSTFVKIPVADYNELNILKTNLLTAIKLIADGNETNLLGSKSEVTHSIGTLIKLLRDFSLDEECDGLTELLKTIHVKNR